MNPLKTRDKYHLRFQKLLKLPSMRLGQFQHLLKTHMILILNFTGPHAIIYANYFPALYANSVYLVDWLIVLFGQSDAWSSLLA